MRLALFLLFIFCWNLCRIQSQARILNPDFEKKLEKLLSHEIPEISCEFLSENFEQFILLDTREWDEYKVSHLKNAKWVGYKSFDPIILKGIPKSAKIVCYCSVGYRSERISKKLLEYGYSNVYNLYGSIFEWINRGYPVYDLSGNEVRRVHVYNKNWSKWLFNQKYQTVY